MIIGSKSFSRTPLKCQNQSLGEVHSWWELYFFSRNRVMWSLGFVCHHLLHANLSPYSSSIESYLKNIHSDLQATHCYCELFISSISTGWFVQLLAVCVWLLNAGCKPLAECLQSCMALAHKIPLGLVPHLFEWWCKTVAFPLGAHLKDLFRNAFIHTCIYPCVWHARESREQSANCP